MDIIVDNAYMKIIKNILVHFAWMRFINSVPKKMTHLFR